MGLLSQLNKNKPKSKGKSFIMDFKSKITKGNERVLDDEDQKVAGKKKRGR